MRIHATTLVALTGLLAIVPAGAGADAQTPSPQAVRAAADATRAAQRVTIEARNGSGLNGSVGLYRIGRSRTRILVQIPRGGAYRVLLYPGSDCVNNRSAAATAVALTPTNFNTTHASAASTIIALPLEKVRSNYVVDVRNANERAAQTAACARLNQ
jgi:hypothetical protein